MATQESRDTIQNMYVGYYGRPADEAGLTFWADLLEANGGDLSAIVDAFGTSDEYTALSAGKSSTELVNLIFNSLFNRDAEGTVGDTATGLGFYVDQLNSGAISAVTIAKNVIDGATNTDAQDLTSIANKLEVANHFTAAVETGNKTYGPDEIDEGQAVINGVTADPATIDTGKSDADSQIGGFPDEEPTEFSLASGIAALDAAEDARTAFLVTADGDEDENTSATESDVADGLTAATTAVDDLVNGNYTAGSTAVRTALLGDQEAANATALTDAQAAQAEKQADVDAVSGLAQAVNTLNAAEDAQTAADADITPKQAALDGAVASYDTLNSATATVAADGTASDGSGNLIVLDTGNLVLAPGITEETNEGVTALLNASIALEAAQTTATDAAATVAAAQAAVDKLDLDSAAQTALAAVGAAMTTTPTDRDAPTAEEIEAEVTALTNGIAALDTAIGGVALGTSGISDDDDATAVTAHGVLTTAAVDDGFISGAEKTAIDTAFATLDTDNSGGGGAVSLADAITASQASLASSTDQLDDFDTLVGTFDTAAAAANPLLDALTTAEDDVTAAQADIDTLAEAVAAEGAAQALVDELAGLNDDIDTAEQAFTDNSLAVPVTLAAGANAATADSDIFKLGDADSSITNFNTSGSDILFIGSDFALNEGDIASAGDDNLLEVFLSEDSGNTVVTLEETAFGSNAQIPEVFEVTLTGIALADVTLTDGAITVA